MNFFDAQERARRSTRRLLSAYVFAAVLIVAGVTLVASAAFRLVGEAGTATPPAVPAAAAVLSALLIVGATLYKTAALSAGGGRVATDMGGTLVPPDIRDPLRRRLRNVVEEMAIASGVVAPEVYVLEAEPGINAFAAGLGTGDAAIAVTRGALETLDRDELQGVVAHEFSHILNGDMRLNVRMIGVLFGIMVLAVIGRTILRGSYHGRAVSLRRDRGAPVILLIGAGLTLLGWLGVLLARMIKAGVSRQRELLADASAVQFTRQTAGLANALKKIGGYGAHSWFRAADPEEVSHMLFARGGRHRALFATHPPLVDRIRALDPSFRDGDWPRVEPRTSPIAAETQGEAAVSALAGGESPSPDSSARPPDIAAMERDAILASVAAPGPAQVALAGRLRRSIPAALYDAAHSQDDAWLLTVGLILHEEREQRTRQLALAAEQIGRERAERIRQFDAALRHLGSGYYLPLLDIAFPALRRRPLAQLEFLLNLIRRLIEADERIDLREYCFLRILAAGLALDFPPLYGHRRTRIGQADTRGAAVLLLRAAARAGARSEPARQQALQAGLTALNLPYDAQEVAGAGGPPGGGGSLRELDRSLELLRRLRADDKKRLLHALSVSLLADDNITNRESELLRAVCAALDCPLPPIAYPQAAPAAG